mmetsp:Transcript_41274/g.86419  ORF Transcript_41274/g.86419 Transcript_41274/m.86419 type:complete len:213 (-) Transcript_41274:383-1021(-)|eukprot:3324643-Pleurochrysis_carterae.AAC.3
MSDVGDVPGYILYNAAARGKTALVADYLAGGANPNWQDELSFTPLQIAAKYGHSRVVQLLLLHGAKPNSLCLIDRTTPLLNAAREGHSECVHMLLEAGADHYHRDRHGHSALDLSIQCADKKKTSRSQRAQAHECARLLSYMHMLEVEAAERERGHVEDIEAAVLIVMHPGTELSFVEEDGGIPVTPQTRPSVPPLRSAKRPSFLRRARRAQ